MDASVIGRDFCPQHLAQLSLPAAPAPRQRRPVGKGLWLTLLASAALHGAALLWWSPQPLPAHAPQALAVTLTSPAEQAPPSEEETAVEPVAEPPPETAAEEEVPQAPPETPDTEAADTKTTPPPALDLSLPAEAPTAPGQPAPPSAVFHPGLRDKVRSARNTRQRLQNTEKSQLTTFKDSAGDTWVDLGNGNCMRSTGGESFTRNWELPRPCGTQLDQGERMLRNMQRAIDESSIIESSTR